MKAKEYLRQIEKLDTLIKNKMTERIKWEDIACSVTPQSQSVTVKRKGKLQRENMESVQSSGNPQKMSNAIERYIDIEKEIDSLFETKKDILSVIEQLEVSEYDLLHKAYVQYIELTDIATMLDKSYSWVTTVHGRALKSVQKILDERENK